MEVLKMVGYVLAAILLICLAMSIGTIVTAFLALATTVGGTLVILTIVVAFVAFCIKEYVEGKK